MTERQHQQLPQTPPAAVRGEPSTECDFCRRSISTTETYHHIVVGMNEEGDSRAAPHSTVEETSELDVCTGCAPKVEAVVDGFLERLWDMREPSDAVDLLDESPPVSEPTLTEALIAEVPSRVLATSLGFVDERQLAIASEMLAVAARGYPKSPEGFALGVAIGRMISAGATRGDISSMVDTIITGSGIYSSGEPS